MDWTNKMQTLQIVTEIQHHQRKSRLTKADWLASLVPPVPAREPHVVQAFAERPRTVVITGPQVSIFFSRLDETDRVYVIGRGGRVEVTRCTEYELLGIRPNEQTGSPG
jgi:hypothetical protein